MSIQVGFLQYTSRKLLPLFVQNILGIPLGVLLPSL
jgi:hypothetical protein